MFLSKSAGALAYSKAVALCVCSLTVPLAIVAQHIGAELRCSVTKEKTLVIELSTFGACGAQSVEAQYVAVFESMARSSRAYVKLERKGSRELHNNVSAPCKGVAGCLEETSYAGSVPVGEMPGGYDVIYVNRSQSAAVDNVSKGHGYILSAHITETAIAEGNNAPVFLHPPFNAACLGKESSSLSQPIDSLDKEDSVIVSFSPVLSDRSRFELAPGSTHGPQGSPAIPAPPYEPLGFTEGFMPDNPFGNGSKVSLGPVTGLMEFIPQKQGNFLISQTITEYRNKQVIGTVQRIFITQIH